MLVLPAAAPLPLLPAACAVSRLVERFNGGASSSISCWNCGDGLPLRARCELGEAVGVHREVPSAAAAASAAAAISCE